MKALVYRGSGIKAVEDRPKPEIKAPDAPDHAPLPLRPDPRRLRHLRPRRRHQGAEGDHRDARPGLPQPRNDRGEGDVDFEKGEQPGRENGRNDLAVSGCAAARFPASPKGEARRRAGGREDCRSSEEASQHDGAAARDVTDRPRMPEEGFPYPDRPPLQTFAGRPPQASGVESGVPGGLDESFDLNRRHSHHGDHYRNPRQR